MKVLLAIALLYIASHVETSPQVAVNRKYRLPLCTRKITNRFLLEEPTPCASKPKSLRTLRVNITPPLDHRVEQKAFVCRLKETAFECTEGFFGGTSCHQVAEVFSSVQTKKCLLMEQTHQAEEGTLTPSDENTLMTDNKLIPEFSWWSTNTIIVKNAILSYTSVLADITDGSISHALLKDLECSESDQILSCENKEWRLVTSRVTVEKCRKPRTIVNTLLEIFTLEKGELYRVNDANLVFTSLLRCEESILKCLPTGTETTRCTPTGYAITLPETYSSTSTSAESVKMPAKLRILESAIASSSLSSKLEFKLLKDQLNEMLCKNSRTTLVSLLAAQRSTPSAVLTLLLGRKTQAVYKNGALYELQCQMTNAVLQPSLEHKGKVARYPLFNSYLGSSTVVAQLTEEGYLSQNVQYSLHYTEKQAFILQGKFIVYKNNTLTSERPALEKIVIDKDLTIAASNFTYSEELTLFDLAEVSNEEDITSNQALHNLIALSTKDFKNRGIHIGEFIRKGHLLDEGILEDTLQARRSPLEVVKSILHITSVSWTAITMVGVSIICLKIYFALRRRRKKMEGKAETPARE